MTIRVASTDADRDAILALSTAFLHTYEPGAPAPAATVDRVLREGVVLLAEREGGDIVGQFGLVVGDYPLLGVRTAFEVVWYVDPAARGATRLGVELVAAAETVARNMGARRVQIGAPASDPRVGRLLDRLAYRAVETEYVKELTNGA